MISILKDFVIRFSLKVTVQKQSLKASVRIRNVRLLVIHTCMTGLSAMHSARAMAPSHVRCVDCMPSCSKVRFCCNESFITCRHSLVSLFCPILSVSSVWLRACTWTGKHTRTNVTKDKRRIQLTIMFKKQGYKENKGNNGIQDHCCGNVIWCHHCEPTMTSVPIAVKMCPKNSLGSLCYNSVPTMACFQCCIIMSSNSNSASQQLPWLPLLQQCIPTMTSAPTAVVF